MSDSVTITSDKTRIMVGEEVTITINVSVSRTNNRLKLLRDNEVIESWSGVYNGQTITYVDKPPVGTHKYHAVLTVYTTDGFQPLQPGQPPQPYQPVSRGI